MWKTAWKASGAYLTRKTHDNPTPPIITFDDLKEVFLAKEWDSFHFSRKNVDRLHLKDFQIWMQIVLEATIDHHNTISLLRIAPHIIDLPLKLDGGQLFLSLEMIDYATFALLM